jgi:hypothetical protein
VKLRIQGSSLRLRLTQKEVAHLRDRGRVESSVEFSPGQALVYRLEGSLQAKSVDASFDGQTIGVSGDQVSIEAPSSAGLHLLIEKDFQCLHGRGEQDRDAFSRPLLA